jgi:hypothetical protein
MQPFLIEGIYIFFRFQRGREQTAPLHHYHAATVSMCEREGERLQERYRFYVSVDIIAHWRERTPEDEDCSDPHTQYCKHANLWPVQ